MSKYTIPFPPFEPLRWELHQAMNELDRPCAYTLFGSSVMYLHGLRQEIGDIDMFVARGLYDVLKQRGWEEQRPREEDPPLLEAWLPGGVLPVHAFYDWKKRGMQTDVQDLLHHPHWVQGWPVQSLSSLKEWKKTIAHHSTRPNDWDDICKIEGYLAAKEKNMVIAAWYAQGELVIDKSPYTNSDANIWLSGRKLDITGRVELHRDGGTIVIPTDIGRIEIPSSIKDPERKYIISR